MGLCHPREPAANESHGFQLFLPFSCVNEGGDVREVGDLLSSVAIVPKIALHDTDF